MPTPYLSMTLPAVLAPGPTWATQISQSMLTIDAHDHTTSKGAPLTGTQAGQTFVLSGDLSVAGTASFGSFSGSSFSGSDIQGTSGTFLALSASVATIASTVGETASFTVLTGTTTTGTLATFATVTGTTVTGTAALFTTGTLTVLTGTTVTGSTALFTTVTGTTVTGSTATFQTVTGTTSSGTLKQATTGSFLLTTGALAQHTTITGTTVTGTTALFNVITGTTVTGTDAFFNMVTTNNIALTGASFTVLTGTTTTGTTAIFQTITGTTVTGTTAQFQTITGTGSGSIFGLQAWQTMSLSNSWVVYGSPFPTASYYKDPVGMVHLQGTVKNGVGTIFTMPAGYRPSAARDFAVRGNGIFASVRVGGAGGIDMLEGTNVALSLDGISFRADQ